MERGFATTSGKACDACRRRKLKCSRSLDVLSNSNTSDQPCGRCMQTRVLCTFNDEQRKRGPRTGKRLRQIRAAQQSANTSAGYDESGPSNFSHNNLDWMLPLSRSLDQAEGSSWDSLPKSCSLYSNTGQADIHQSPSGPDLNEVSFAAHVSFRHSSSAIGDPELDEFGISFPNTILLDEQELQLWSMPGDDFLLSKEKLLMEVRLFFDSSYAAYPVLHQDTVIKNINQDVHLFDHGFRALVLSVFMLNEACKLRSSPEHGTAAMHFLAKTIENLRNDASGNHFSDNPTVDTIIVSLFLFIANNVSQKHNRAFCYLTEAIGLFDLIGCIYDPVESVRLTRLEYVLYVTESASVSIYGSQRKRKISCIPMGVLASAAPLYWLDNSTEALNWPQDYMDAKAAKLDRIAVDLLLLITRLHAASDLIQVASVSVEDRLMTTVGAALNSQTGTQTSMYITQTADVAITRQWKLASFWWNKISVDPIPTSSTEHLTDALQMIGMATLTWCKILHPGSLRIVGLGKLVTLTETLLKISSRLETVGGCTSMIRNLVHTVAETDHDRYFAPRLSMMEVCVGSVPRSLLPDDEFEQLLQRGNWG